MELIGRRVTLVLGSTATTNTCTNHNQNYPLSAHQKTSGSSASIAHHPHALLDPTSVSFCPLVSRTRLLCIQLTLGENGVFWNEKDSAAAANGDPAINGSTAETTSRACEGARPQPSANGRGLPPPLPFSAPNTISRRSSYPYGDSGGGSGGGGDAGAGAGAGGGSSAEANGAGRGGGGGVPRRSHKRVARTRIAAKATVSNAFRR